MEVPLLNYNTFFTINKADYAKIRRYNWRLLVNKRDGYVTKYVVSTVYTAPYKPKTIYLHRLITNCPVGMVVDHKNGNTLDNRRRNLRVCTVSENNSNRKRQVYLGYVSKPY